MTDSILNTITDRIQDDARGPFKIDWKQYEQETRDVLKELKEGKCDERGALEAIVELVGYHTGRGYPELPDRTN